MKISYAITVCNEFVEIQRLVSFLLTHKRKEDNIVNKDKHELEEEKYKIYSNRKKKFVRTNINVIDKLIGRLIEFCQPSEFKH